MSVLTVDIRVEVPNFGVDATFSAATGITVLSGPSGSGKSLTLAAIAGTLRPARGVIRVDNVVLADVEGGVHVRSQDRRLGVVYQHAALLDHRSPLDNVMLAVREGDEASRRSTAMALLERVGAAGLARAKTRLLSGGERQRVALARAMAGAPRLLLLDEPFSSLDASSRAEMRRLLKALVVEHQLIALVVTHDQADVDALADRVVVYEPGRTVSASE
ncbi:MAG: ATP-binding cassette domain-containing protein [Ilumatobacteraceae bacterium]